MEYRNLSNLALCLFSIFLLIVFVPFVSNTITTVAVTFFAVKLAEWFMETTRKYFLYERVSPKNKVILITGCDTGFGNLLARRMDKLGYSVLATCLYPDGDGAKKLTEDCSKKLTVLPMDVTDEHSILKVKSYVEKNLEPNVLWAVVNNAGVAQCGQIDWTPVEEFQQTCDVNTFGTLRVTKAFLPYIKQSKGRIVNVASTAGHIAFPGLAAYCMSKSAAIALTTGLQMELHKWGVKCSSIEPFAYATPLTRKQTVFALTRRTWNAAPTNIRDEYGEEYFKVFKTAIDRFLFLFVSSDISEVIHCMEDAITAEDPLPVYIPGNLLPKIMLLFVRALPLGMKENIFAFTAELGGNPLALKTKNKKK